MAIRQSVNMITLLHLVRFMVPSTEGHSHQLFHNSLKLIMLFFIEIGSDLQYFDTEFGESMEGNSTEVN